MTSITDSMKTEGKAKIEAKEVHGWTMWHNGHGNSMTRGFEDYVSKQRNDDGHTVCMRVRQNKETGRWTFNWSAGFENITQKRAEEMLQAYAAS